MFSSTLPLLNIPSTYTIFSQKLFSHLFQDEKIPIFFKKFPNTVNFFSRFLISILNLIYAKKNWPPLDR